jgi:hypothetical protein
VSAEHEWEFFVCDFEFDTETDPEEDPCPFHSAGNQGRCNYCEDQ